MKITAESMMMVTDPATAVSDMLGIGAGYASLREKLLDEMNEAVDAARRKPNQKPELEFDIDMDMQELEALVAMSGVLLLLCQASVGAMQAAPRPGMKHAAMRSTTDALEATLMAGIADYDGHIVTEELDDALGTRPR